MRGPASCLVHSVPSAQIHTGHTQATQQYHSCGNMHRSKGLRECSNLVFSQPCLLDREGNILKKSNLISLVLYQSQRVSAPFLCLPLFAARDLGENGDSHFEFYSSEPGLGLTLKEQRLWTPHLLQTLLVSLLPSVWPLAWWIHPEPQPQGHHSCFQKMPLHTRILAL